MPSALNSLTIAAFGFISSLMALASSWLACSALMPCAVISASTPDTSASCRCIADASGSTLLMLPLNSSKFVLPCDTAAMSWLVTFAASDAGRW